MAIDPPPEAGRGSFVAFDLETTGLFAETDRVVEVGAVRFDASGRELGRFERLIDPGRPMSPAAQAVHGISDAHLAGAPPASAVLPEFVAWIGDPATTTLLAHNAGFDTAFLGRELARAGQAMPGHRVVDTLALARDRLPHAPNHQLDTLARLLDLDPDGPHRALADSLRVKGIWLALAVGLEPSALVAYPIEDRRGGSPVPVGWERLAVAIARGYRVRLEYAGGTRGEAPREITPRRFVHKGGLPYVIALCHLDHFEKAFRLDRVRAYEVLEAPAIAVENLGAGRVS
jgi:DNA polymerase III epsilon subunit family exonuclease